jgi:phage N-6-adenine-methyltransferase
LSRIWSTPQKLFDKLHEEFRFDWDLCADPDNAKLPNWITGADSLRVGWRRGVCWLNPPYGREIGLYMEKAHREAVPGVKIVCLVPGRTNAPWWHDYVMKASEIRFIRRKVPFVDQAGKCGGVPPYGSTIVIFAGMNAGTIYKSWDYRALGNEG